MFDLQSLPSEPHAVAKFWLQVADEIIKATAVLVGAAWTWMNYRRSRTYAKKLELQITGEAFFRSDLYIDVAVVLKNLGAAKHVLQAEGTSCGIVAILDDLTEQDVCLFPVFTLHNQIEPGEAVSDQVQWRIEHPSGRIVWLKINLRVVSGKVEWNTASMVRIEDERGRR